MGGLVTTDIKTDFSVLHVYILLPIRRLFQDRHQLDLSLTKVFSLLTFVRGCHSLFGL